MTGVRPGRCHTAINTAWRTNWRSCRGLIDQPTTHVRRAPMTPSWPIMDLKSGVRKIGAEPLRLLQPRRQTEATPRMGGPVAGR